MKDYSAMSDFEINKAVAICNGLFDFMFFNVDHDVVNGPVWATGDCNVNGISTSKGNPFNPCNNPADAWTIITENRITLLWIEKTSIWCAAIGGLVEHDYWGWDECPELYSENINPLRAAMISYLMMKDAEKCDG